MFGLLILSLYHDCRGFNTYKIILRVVHKSGIQVKQNLVWVDDRLKEQNPKYQIFLDRRGLYKHVRKLRNSHK